MYTFGADIEIWAVSDKHVPQNPKAHDIVPAYYALGGDVVYNLPHGKLFPDGAALEFTVTPGTLAELFERIDDNVELIRELMVRRGFFVDATSFGYVGVDKIHSVPMEGSIEVPTDRDRRVCMTILGCSPDVNVYGRRIRRPDPKRFPWRSLGGHVHIGLPQPFRTYEILDAVVSLLDLEMKPIFDEHFTRNDKERTRLYGVYGTFRAKSYGVEYRPIPARFLVDPKLRQLVFDRVDHVCSKISSIDPQSAYEEIVGATRQEVEYGLFE